MCVVAGITPSQEMSKEASVCDPVPLDSEDPLFMLYTSGSTGKPKGILHTQAGYLLMAGLTQQVLTYILFPSAHLIALSLSSSLSLSLLLPLSLSPSLSLLLSPSLSLSMYLTIVLVMYLRVWLTLVGSLVTRMLCTVPSVMEAQQCCLRALQYTLDQVSFDNDYYHCCTKPCFSNQQVQTNIFCYQQLSSFSKMTIHLSQNVLLRKYY